MPSQQALRSNLLEGCLDRQLNRQLSSSAALHTVLLLKGHERRFRDVLDESAYPLKLTSERTFHIGSEVPMARLLPL
jgi:hypothetical protein